MADHNMTLSCIHKNNFKQKQMYAHWPQMESVLYANIPVQCRCVSVQHSVIVNLWKMMHTNTLYDVFIFFKISFHTFFEVKKVNIINKRNKNNKVFCEIEKKDYKILSQCFLLKTQPSYQHQDRPVVCSCTDLRFILSEYKEMLCCEIL